MTTEELPEWVRAGRLPELAWRLDCVWNDYGRDVVWGLAGERAYHRDGQLTPDEWEARQDARRWALRQSGCVVTQSVDRSPVTIYVDLVGQYATP